MAHRKLEDKTAVLTWTGCPNCKLRPKCDLYQRLKVSPSFDSLDLASNSLRQLSTEGTQRIERRQIVWWKDNLLRVICSYGTLFSAKGEVASYKRQSS